MEVCLGKASAIKKVVEVIRGVMDGANFAFFRNLLLIRKEYSDVLLEISVSPAAFNSYRCEETFSAYIELVEIFQHLLLSEDNDFIILKTQQLDGHITLGIENPRKYHLSHFPLHPLLDITSPEVEEPFDTIIELPSATFTSICNHVISETLSIRVSDTEAPTFTTTTEDLQTISTTCRHVVHEANVLRMVQPLIVTFQMSHLTLLRHTLALCDMLTINLATEEALAVFAYRIVDSVSVRFTLPIHYFSS